MQYIHDAAWPHFLEQMLGIIEDEREAAAPSFAMTIIIIMSVKCVQINNVIYNVQ